MASFTDELIQFNPYVSQIPDSYYTVGVAKQQQYDMGVQKVQSYIDSVAGLEVMKGVQKDYINSRVSELTTHLNKIAAGSDFADQSFVNQIGGYASKLASDPIVQGAVASTMIHKKNLQSIEDERKKGVPNVSNEWDYNKQLNDWLNDGDVKSQFSGRYSNYIDVMGEFYKAFKEAHPSSTLTQDAFRRTEDGKIELNPAMQEQGYKGISPKDVQEIANLTFNRPEIKNQLRIDGQYSYRGVDQNGLATSVRDNYQSMIDQTNKQIEDLRLKMTNDKTVDKTVIAEQIEQLKDAGSKIVEDYKDYAGLIASNPEAAKAALYQNNLMSNLMKSFSWSDSTTKIVDNPLYKAQLDMMNYNLNVSKFNTDTKLREAEINIKQQDTQTREKKAAAGKLGPGDSEIFYTPKNIEQAQGELGSTSFNQQLISTKQRYSDLASEGVNMIAGVSNILPPKIKDAEGRWIWNPAYSSPKAAEAQYNRIFTDSEKYYREGKAGATTSTMFKQLDPLMRSIRAMENTIKKIDASTPKLEQVTKELGNVNRDLVDYWVFENTDGETSKAAATRLESKLGSDWKKQITDRLIPPVVDEFGRQVGGSGTDIAEFARISKVLNKNKTLVPDLQSREDQYKRAQLGFIPQQGDIITAKPEEQRAVTQQYVSALSELAKDNQSQKIKDMLSWTKDDVQSSKEGKVSGNVYGGYYNRFSGKAYLTMKRGDEIREAEVPLDVFQNMGFKTSDPFWDIHGADLSISGNTTTNVDGANMGSAYEIDMPEDSPYTVKYHLVGNGAGTYSMQVYVIDDKGKVVLPGVSYVPPGLGRFMTPDEIMTTRTALANNAVIQGLINRNKK